MSNEVGKIHLKGPVDYLIFTSATIKVGLGSGRVVYALIADHEDGKAVLQCRGIESWGPMQGQAGQSVEVSAPYKSMVLTFSADVVEMGSHGHLTVQLPLQGTLREQRNAARARLTGSDLRVELQIEGVDGLLRFQALALDNYSFESIALFLNRADGLTLPGDVVRQIQVFKGDTLVLEGAGSVLLVDKTRQTQDHPDSYVVVVRLDAPAPACPLQVGRSRRRSERVSLLEEQNAFVEFQHPLAPEVRLSGYLSDLSNSGLSILLESGMPPIPVGLLVADASLQLPLKPRIPIELRVVTFQQIEQEDAEGERRIGLEFQNMSPALVKAVTAILQREVSEHLVDASSEDYDRLWEFYFETGFIYGGKRKQIQAHAAKCFNTFQKLLQSNTPLLKKILYREGDEIKGHINAVRFFDQSFIIQHLNALKASGESAGRAVIQGINTFFVDAKANRDSGARYVMAFYRPNNLYPAAVFGGSAQIIDDPQFCWTVAYGFAVPPKAPVAVAGNSDNVDVWEANEADRAGLETLLITTGEHQLMRAEGLTQEKMVHLDITREYESIGLYRYRRIFVAEHSPTRHRAYAVCNYASPGINLSELTNSIKFFFSAPHCTENQALIDRLTVDAAASYAETDMPEMVLLLLPGQPTPKGYAVTKTYTQWFIDTNYGPQFRDASLRVFENIRSYLRRRKVPEAS